MSNSIVGIILSLVIITNVIHIFDMATKKAIILLSINAYLYGSINTYLKRVFIL